MMRTKFSTTMMLQSRPFVVVAAAAVAASTFLLLDGNQSPKTLPIATAFVSTGLNVVRPAITTGGISSASAGGATVSHTTNFKNGRLSEAHFRLGYVEDKNDWKTVADVTVQQKKDGLMKEDLTSSASSSAVQEMTITKNGPLGNVSMTAIPPTSSSVDAINTGLDYTDYGESQNFVYGQNSQSYRGLTRPTKAAAVLAVILSSGLVFTSPDLDVMNLDVMSATSALLPSLVQQTEHWFQILVESDLSSSLETLRSALDSNVQDLSINVERILADAAATSSTISMDVNAGLDNIIEQGTHVKDFAVEQLSGWQQSTMASMNQVCVEANILTEEVKATVADKVSEWQPRVDQWQVQVGTSVQQLRDQGNEVVDATIKVTSTMLANLEQDVQTQKDLWTPRIIEASNQLRSRLDLAVAQGNKLVVEKAAEWKEIGQDTMNHMESAVEATSTLLSAKAQQSASQASHVATRDIVSLQTTFAALSHQLDEDVARVGHQLQTQSEELAVQIATIASEKYDDIVHASQEEVDRIQTNLELAINEIREEALRESQVAEASFCRAFDEVNLQSLDTLAKVGATIQGWRQNVDLQLLELHPTLASTASSIQNLVAGTLERNLSSWSISEDQLAEQSRMLHTKFDGFKAGIELVDIDDLHQATSNVEATLKDVQSFLVSRSSESPPPVASTNHVQSTVVGAVVSQTEDSVLLKALLKTIAN